MFIPPGHVDGGSAFSSALLPTLVGLFPSLDLRNQCPTFCACGCKRVRPKSEGWARAASKAASELRSVSKGIQRYLEVVETGRLTLALMSGVVPVHTWPSELTQQALEKSSSSSSSASVDQTLKHSSVGPDTERIVAPVRSGIANDFPGPIMI